MPTVCGMCPVGCNISATTREGKVKRDPLAQPSRGRRRLALRQGPLRVLAPLRERPRHRAAPAPSERRRSRRRRGTTRSTRPSACCARPARTSSPRSRAPRRWSRRTRSRSCCAAGSARTPRSCPRSRTRALLDGFRRPLSSIRDADVIVVLGDEPLAERAPIVDLWVRAARRQRRRGPVRARRGQGARRRARDPDLVGPSGDDATLAARRRARSASGRAFYLPRARRTRAASARRGPPRPTRRSAESPDPVRLLVISGDEALANPACARSPSRPSTCSSFAMFERPARALADLVLPGTSYLEREGTYVNLEGRLQRLRRAVCRRRRTSSRGSQASPSASASTSRRMRPVVFEELSALIYDGLPFSAIGEQAPLPRAQRRPASRSRRRRKPRSAAARTAACASSRTGRSSPAPRSSACPSCSSSARSPCSRSPHDDARARGIAAGDEVEVQLERNVGAPARARLAQARRRERFAPPRSTSRGLPHDVEVKRA